MKILEIKDFSLLVNEKEYIKNLNFSVSENEIIGIKSESGTGKTSLLDFISNTFHKDSNYECSGFKETKADIRISRVFQEPRFIESISVYKNIKLSSEKNISEAEIKKIAGELNVLDCLKKYPSQLSGGQLQRCSFMRAILHSFDLLLLDEPFAFQDLNNKNNLILFLNKILSEKKAGCIIVSHDMSDFEQLNANIINIKNQLDC